jgi:hypothetical protein
MHINDDDYDAMENAVSNIMTLDKAKKDHSKLIEEIHNSDYTMDEVTTRDVSSPILKNTEHGMGQPETQDFTGHGTGKIFSL